MTSIPCGCNQAGIVQMQPESRCVAIVRAEECKISVEGGRVRACRQWLRSVRLCSYTALNSFSIDFSLYKTKHHSLIGQRSKARAARPQVVCVNNHALYTYVDLRQLGRGRRPIELRWRHSYEAQRV